MLVNCSSVIERNQRDGKGEGWGWGFYAEVRVHVPLQFGLDEYSGMLMRNDAACINKENIFCMALLPTHHVPPLYCLYDISFPFACMRVRVCALFDK